MKRKIDLETCYRIIFEALTAGSGMQSITNALFAYTKMPIHAVDISFNVIAASYDKTIGSKHIDEMILKKAVPSKVVIEDYYRLGYIDNMEKQQKSSIVDWGVVEVPQASGAIRINGNVAGYCATTCSDPSMKSIALQVNDILCKALGIEMERQQRTLERAANPIHEVIARELFRDILPNYEPNENTCFLDMKRLKPGYQILVISSGGQSISRIQYIRKSILDIFPDAFYVIKGGYLYILFANVPKTWKEGYFIQTIEQLMERYRCYCGISGIFLDLSCRPGFRLRAQKALEVGHALNPDKSLYSFDEYYLEIIASYAVNELGEYAYRLVELDRLIAVDKEKNTEYFHTLKTYIMLGNNINHTASNLHIHRNTLIYRLSKISDIMGLDINNRQIILRLVIAMTMQYVDNAMKHKESPSSL